MRFLWMDKGAWHRLDNDFALLVAVVPSLYFMDNGPETEEVLQWAFLILVLLFQQQNPWGPLNGVIPVSLAASLCALRHARRRRLPRWFLGARAFWEGLVLLGLGAACYIRGLNDSRDYLRLSHSAWHLFGGLALLRLLAIPKPPRKQFIGDSQVLNV